MSNKESFEVRLKEWESMHPRQWVATTDRSQVAMFLSEQTLRVVEAQLEAADRIVLSQEGIAREVNSFKAEVKEGLRGIEVGIEGLNAIFEWGFSELIWRLEQQNELLKEILETLQAPLDTAAKELRKRAERAYQNAWIDDALKDFLESEKRNRYDFTVHLYLGSIYLFHKNNDVKALEYYEKAVKYASPEASHYAAFSLLHIGLIKYLQTDFQSAYKATQKAIELDPSLYEAHYQHAQYCAKLGEHEEALKHLDIAVKGDRYYCAKASSEKDFDAIREKLRPYFEDIREKIQAYAAREINRAEKLFKRLKPLETRSVTFINLTYFKRYAEPFKKYWRERLAIDKEELDEVKASFKRATVFDSWDSLQRAGALISLLKKHGEELVNNINDDFLLGSKMNMRGDKENKYGWILGLVGAAGGVLFAGRITGIFSGASPTGGRMFLFVLALLFFGGLGFMLYLIGETIGGKIVFPRRWKDEFGEQEERLNKIERVLALTSGSKKHEWEDVLNSTGKASNDEPDEPVWRIITQ